MICSIGIKLLSSKRLVGTAGNAFPSKEIKLQAVLMILSAYVEQDSKNFVGISFCDTLRSCLRQALLLFFFLRFYFNFLLYSIVLVLPYIMRIYGAQRVGAESQTLRSQQVLLER